MKNFRFSFLISCIALIIAFIYRGGDGIFTTAILGILEISLSFDNAIVNAVIVNKMSPWWQKIFLSLGIIIAALGMRLIFPLVIIWITAGIDPLRGFDLALHPPLQGETYAQLVQAAHPEISAFGGCFLLLLFLNFLTSPREKFWLTWCEKYFARIGSGKNIEILLVLIFLLLATFIFAQNEKRTQVLIAGILGIIIYTAVELLKIILAWFEDPQSTGELSPDPSKSHKKISSNNTYPSGLGLFIYLEIIDSSFSLDGVIGAFAITADPILITLGLGFIGSIFVRSITMYMVERETLSEYIYLEHGAHWAIGALSIIMLITVGGLEVRDIITGMIGVVFIGLALMSSIVHRHKAADISSSSDFVR